MCSEMNKKVLILMEALTCNGSQTLLRSLKYKLLGVSLECQKMKKL